MVAPASVADQIPSVADQIRERAAVARRPGTYIGHFEWLVWGHLERSRVLMLYGDHVVDMPDYFSPPSCGEFKSTIRVAAVAMRRDGWGAATIGGNGALTANHFVIGKASGQASGLRGGATPHESARRAALRAGWLLLPTIADGDCGLDAMAHHLGLERCKATWTAIRSQLADFMVANAGDAGWQALFGMCAEGALGSGVGLGPQKKPPPSAPPPLPPPMGEPASSQPSVGLGSAVVSLSLVASDIGDDVRDDAVREHASCGGAAGAEDVEPLLAMEDEGAVSALPVVAVSGPNGFADYIAGLSLDDLAEKTKSLEAWREAEESWLLAQQSSASRPPPAAPRRRHATSNLKYRLATGRRFELWLKGQGSSSTAKLSEFLKTFRVYDGAPPKRDRVWLASCLRSWQAVESGGVLALASRHSRGGRKAAHRTPDALLQRHRGAQGAPYKCPELRELLWDWFVDIRRSLATIVTPKFLLLKAKETAERMLRAMRSTGHYTALPKLDKHWLLRWKRQYGVVLRRPNMRYKCSKEALLTRLRAMWLNVIRVRRLALCLLGKDLADQMYGLDEKPVHFNEAGSKGVGTLEIQGAPSVRLKENHAATRERVSLMTSVTSNPSAASRPEFMPFELLCRAKSANRVSKLQCPSGLKVSVAWAEKGSYRQEHVLAFLRRWLDPWTEERASRQDWRILFMDVARSHCGPEVLALCHERGYVLLYHYGCTTGVAQVNDTDLHGPFEKAYIELEQTGFNLQQMYDPGCISRSLQAVLDDAAAAWRLCDHSAGVRGHMFNGLSIALDGSEDHLIGRDAASLWREGGMPDARLRAIAEVDDAIASGAITSFADWQKVVFHPENPGVIGLEGAELEDGFEPGESKWLTAEEESAIAEEEAAMLEKRVDDEISREQGSAQGVGTEALAPLVDDASRTLDRLNKLKRLRAEAVDLAIPSALFTMDRRIRDQERALAAGRGSAHKTVSEVLKRHLEDRDARLREAVGKKQKQAAAQRKAAAKARKLKRRRNAAKAQAKKAAKELQAKLASLPVTFSVLDCGKPGDAGLRARVRCLERLKLRSPPLTFEEDARWTVVRDTFAARYRSFRKIGKDFSVGATFIGEVNGVLAKLVEHYEAPTRYNKDGQTGGNPEAFRRFYKVMASCLPKAATIAEM